MHHSSCLSFKVSHSEVKAFKVYVNSKTKLKDMDGVFFVKIGLFVILAIVAFVNYVKWVESKED